MSNEELQEKYADTFLKIEWLRKVLVLYERDDADISKKALGERLVEFAAIQLEIQFRLVSGAAAGRWCTGTPEHEGVYLTECTSGVEYYAVCSYRKYEWSNKGVLRWMEIPGEKYGGAE